MVRPKKHPRGPDEKLATRILHFSEKDVITQGTRVPSSAPPLRSQDKKIEILGVSGPDAGLSADLGNIIEILFHKKSQF